MFGRKDDLAAFESFTDSLEYWRALRTHFAKKADHNKNETHILVASAIVAALMSSAFVTLGDSFILSKVAPTTLNSVVILAVVWLRFRQPQKLWGIYRSAQRELENEKYSHELGLGQYERLDESEKNKAFSERLLEIHNQTHKLWSATVPDIDVITKTLENKDLKK